MNKTKPKKKTDEESQKATESKKILDFLLSPNGMTFLVDRIREQEKETNKTTEEIINDLLDFYSTWGRNFPIKKSYDSDLYTVLKGIESFCAKKENKSYFDYLFF